MAKLAQEVVSENLLWELILLYSHKKASNVHKIIPYSCLHYQTNENFHPTCRVFWHLIFFYMQKCTRSQSSLILHWFMDIREILSWFGITITVRFVAFIMLQHKAIHKFLGNQNRFLCSFSAGLENTLLCTVWEWKKKWIC